MRWFIEVSRLGEDTPIDRYCLEAKQWQAALQEARKRRGDTGPLSKFSIELLEHGYRAVDPAQQIRYVVNKAPPDASLSQPPPPQPGGTAPGSFPAPPRVPSVSSASPVITNAPEPVPSTDPVASPLPPSDPLAAGPKTDPMAALPPESHPPRTDPLPQAAPPRPAHPAIVIPADRVPPVGAGSPAATTQPMTPPGTPAAPTAPAQAPGHMTQRSMEAAREPDFQIVKKREEEPTEKVPIIYREYSYAVKPGTDRASIEVLLWMRFRELSASLQNRTNRKYIQLAVFDHVFEKKPARAPVATLMWKDWRGEPVIQYPSASSPPPAMSSSAPLAVTAAPPVVAASAPAVQLHPAPVLAAAPAAATDPPAQSLSTEPAPAAAHTERAAPPTQPLSAPPAPLQPAAAAPAHAPQPFAPSPSSPQSAPAPVEPPVVVQPAPVLVQPAPAPAPVLVQPAPAPAPSSPQSAPAPVEQPVVVQAAPVVAEPAPAPIPTPATSPLKRRADEDLIGELFEAMHDLHFMPDMMTGVDFVLGILNKTLPSEAVLVHIFDINSRQFVVVRAIGPSQQAVVLHRTPDQEPMFRRVMRGTRSAVTTDAASNESYRNPRWNLLGVVPEVAVFGPVQLHGRYLGAIELANPLGGGAYTEHEAHALDYICEQLAEFLAQRPIIVDADVVLGKA